MKNRTVGWAARVVKVFSWLLGGVTLLAVALAVWRLGLNYSGYCRAEGRYLSDREKTEIVVARVLSLYPPVVDLYEMSNGAKVRVGRTRPPDPIPYGSLGDFFQVNPDCCELTPTARKEFTAPLLARLSGRFSTFVRVRYLVRYRDRNGEEFSEPIEEYHAVSNCGRIRFFP